MIEGLAKSREKLAATVVALSNALPGSGEADELTRQKAKLEEQLTLESKALRDLELDYDFT